MPTTYKILGQATYASSPVVLYLVPSSPVTETVVSSITVANRGPVLAYFRVSINPGGVGIFPEQYLYYDVPLAPSDTFIATVGLTLQSTDTITVQGVGPGSSGDDLSFQLFGSEITP